MFVVCTTSCLSRATKRRENVKAIRKMELLTLSGQVGLFVCIYLRIFGRIKFLIYKLFEQLIYRTVGAILKRYCYL